jgi:hypothetical protein
VPVYSEYSVIIQPDSGETAEHSESWRRNVVNVTSLQAVAMSLLAGRVQTVQRVHRSARPPATPIAMYTAVLALSCRCRCH